MTTSVPTIYLVRGAPDAAYQLALPEWWAPKRAWFALVHDPATGGMPGFLRTEAALTFVSHLMLPVATMSKRQGAPAVLDVTATTAQIGSCISTDPAWIAGEAGLVSAQVGAAVEFARTAKLNALRERLGKPPQPSGPSPLSVLSSREGGIHEAAEAAIAAGARLVVLWFHTSLGFVAAVIPARPDDLGAACGRAAAANGLRLVETEDPRDVPEH